MLPTIIRFAVSHGFPYPASVSGATCWWVAGRVWDMETKEEEIIKVVALWLQPNIDIELLKESLFYGAVVERVKEIIQD